MSDRIVDLLADRLMKRKAQVVGLSAAAYEVVTRDCEDCNDMVEAAKLLMKRHSELSDVEAATMASEAMGELGSGAGVEEILETAEELYIGKE